MFKVNQREIGQHSAPYIIAEVSANHNGCLEKAKQTISAAHQQGAHAVKIQTYTPDTMTIDCQKDDFKVRGGLWDGYSLYDLYREAHTPYEWHKTLFDHAKNLGVTLFSSPFDESAVDLLSDMNAPAYKIASFEMTDIPLIRYIARLKKPIFMSTGMASIQEIHESLAAIRSISDAPVLLFHCISSYPAPIDQANLKAIQTLKSTFGVEIGLSDHTVGHTAAIAAVALGATAIEKHFTLSRQDPGPDSAFSIEPDELQQLVKLTSDTWRSLGDGSMTRPTAEKDSTTFRRSLYFVKDLHQGDVISSASLRRIRPGFGLPPKFYEQILGQKVSRDIQRGEAVQWDMIQVSEQAYTQG